jgi:hypothetical protein
MFHKIEVGIPEEYLWMTAGYRNREKMFRAYVKGYISQNYPKLQFVRIQGMIAICERKEITNEERQEAKSYPKEATRSGRTKSK